MKRNQEKNKNKIKSNMKQENKNNIEELYQHHRFHLVSFQK